MNFFSRVLFSLFLIFSSLVFFDRVSACTCADYDVPSCARYAAADAVFIGKVERITSAGNEADTDVTSDGVNSISWRSLGMVFVHFKIEKSFKGSSEKVIKALTYQGTSCDLGVKKGQKWLIYASKNDDTGNLSFGACGGNYQIKRNSAEEKELEDLSKGKSPETVVGRVAEESYADGMKNIKVTLEGDGVNLSTVTDQHGVYEFVVPGPGKYRVKVYVPYAAHASRYVGQRDLEVLPSETETSFEYEAETEPHSCDYEAIFPYKIDLKATGEIRWRFVDRAGNSVNASDVKLCPVKSTEMETLRNCNYYFEKESDGFSRFGGLREGSFVLVVDTNDFPEFGTPYSRLYFPGVRNFSDAQVINLEQAQKLRLSDFKLPEPAPLQEVKGKIFWKDRKSVTSVDLSDDGVYFSFYNPQNSRSSLSMSHYLSPAETAKDGLKFNEDGTFSFLGFVGQTYSVKFSARNKKGKEYIRQVEITITKDIAPLEIYLEDDKK